MLPRPRRWDSPTFRTTPTCGWAIAASDELDDAVLVAPVRAQKRQRNAQLVVEGLRRGGGLRSQEQPEHLLGGGLAVAARDPDDRQAEAAPVGGGEVGERAARVGDAHHGVPHHPVGVDGVRAVGQRRHGSGRERLAQEVMAVHLVAAEGDKELSAAHPARVDRNASDG
jgi:hypothetical protein